MKTLSKTLTLIPSVFATSLVVAADQPVEHETVVVTANRTAMTVDDSISSVKVFNEEDIKNSGARSIADLLSTTAGIKLTSNGGRGANSSLFIRGTNSTHVLVLIDGVKVGSATNGGVNYESIPLSQIERVELVKGPRSSLYGSEAIGGILQIFTKKGTEETKVAGSVGAGSQETIFSNATVRGASGNFSYSLGVSGESTQGANANDNPSSFGFDADDDGYEEFSGNVNVAYKVGADSEISAFVLQTEGDKEFDGSSQDSSEVSLSTLGLGAMTKLADSWYLDVKLGRSEDFSDNYKNGVYASTFDSTRDTVQLVNDFVLSSNVSLIAGADYEKEKVDVIDPFASYIVTERENHAGFAQVLFSSDSLSAELSGRYDDNEQFGSTETGSVGVGIPFAQNFRATASFGTAFRAPTFNELYYVGYGTPTLQPEKSKTAELGLRWENKSSNASISVYDTEVKNLIATDTRPDGMGGLDYFAANIGKAEIKGVDVTLGHKFTNSLVGNIELSYVDAKDASGGSNDGNRLQRRPKSQALVNVGYLGEKWTSSADFVVSGSTYNNLSNTTKIDDYRIVNLRTSYAVSEYWTIAASVENVFDSEYVTVTDYPENGRLVLLSLNYQN